MIKVIGFI